MALPVASIHPQTLFSVLDFLGVVVGSEGKGSLSQALCAKKVAGPSRVDWNTHSYVQERLGI